MKIDKQDIKESLVVFGIFTGMLLPMRLLFYDYLQHYWIGSFGVTSCVVFTVFYLSKKGKLGKIGIMITNKIEKRAKGKLGKFTIILSCIFIYFWSLAIGGITAADEQVSKIVMTDLKKQGITDIKSLSEKSPKISTSQHIAETLILLTPNPLSFLAFKIVNNLSNGWLLAFGSVFLVDEIEVLGIAIYFRYKKSTILS